MVRSPYLVDPMFGIPRLDPFGVVHASFGITALALGLGMVTAAKGTSFHRKLGFSYVFAMLLLNATALWIYDLYGRFGPFHVASVISLATIAAGYAPLLFRHSLTEWMALHGYFMSWSYVGLIAAFIAEVAVRVPGVGFSSAVVSATVVTVLGGALLIHTRVPVIVRRLMPLTITSTR